MKRLVGYTIIVFFLLPVWIYPAERASGGEIFHYKSQVNPLEYNLSIVTKSQAMALFSDGPTDEQKDVIRLSQEVVEMDTGLLQIELTVLGINRANLGEKPTELYLTPRGGSAYKRKEIIGNKAQTLINLLGAVKGVKAIPHFGSVYFHPGSLDGPPLDVYRAMTMIYPQFPMRLLNEGDTWNVKDEIQIDPAEVIPIGGLGTLKHELSMTVKRDMAYTLIGYVQRGSYRTAHIGFNATFAMEGEMITESGGDFIEGNGKSSGDFYFAPTEGFLVEAHIKSEVNEDKSMDGNVVHWFNADKSMAVFLGQKTAPLSWLTSQDLRFDLVE